MATYEKKTEKGYDLWEAASALQKSIRRGDEDGANAAHRGGEADGVSHTMLLHCAPPSS